MLKVNLTVPQELIAKAFSTVLKKWLSPETIAVVVELTKKETDPGICHSADYCDANMAMHAAFINTGVLIADGEEEYEEVITDNQELTDLWNNSWDLAKKNFFYVEAPRTPEELVHYLNAKYESIEFGLATKDESGIDDEDAADVLICFEADGMDIVNPLFSSCSRFEVDSKVEYGIEKEDAELINKFNNVSM